MNTVFLLLGGNLGDRLENLEMAQKAVAARIGTVKQASAIYETAAWGKLAQPDYLNQVLEVSTALTAEEVLEAALSIEKDQGRIRKKIWEPRLIDIDILLYNQDIIHLQHLKIPHPHLQHRRFALVPLAAIAPELVHPVLKRTIRQLLQECRDMLPVKNF